MSEHCLYVAYVGGQQSDGMLFHPDLDGNDGSDTFVRQAMTASI